MKDQRKNVNITPKARAYLKAISEINKTSMVNFFSSAIDKKVSELSDEQRLLYDTQMSFLKKFN